MFRKIMGKRLLSIAVIICFMITIILLQNNNSAEGYKSAYKEFLENINIAEKSENFDYLRDYFGDVIFDEYFIYDLNKDRTPELFLYSNSMDGMMAIYTYSNKQVKFLDYNAYTHINEYENSIIVNGHWHGAGGSGQYEWQIYDIYSNKLRLKYYIDHMGDYENVAVVKNGDWGNKSASKNKYKEMYGKYVKGATSILEFKRYGVKDGEGLR